MTILGTDSGCRQSGPMPNAQHAHRARFWSGVEELPESRDALPLAGGERSEEGHLPELGARRADAYHRARRSVDHASPPAAATSSRRPETISASPSASGAA